MMRSLDVRRLGRVSYEAALGLQRELVEARKADRIPDTLLLLEHPHVLTLGVRVKRDGGAAGSWPNVLASAERLSALGVSVFETGRGGDVTYHGPGQIVGYPILDLRPDRQDVHRYVRDLEEVLIRACSDFGVNAHRVRGLTGAWVDRASRGAEKVAAIGVRISRWITSHGFALNVNTDLSFFDLIVPCGITGVEMTSIERETGTRVGLPEATQAVVRAFEAVFEVLVEPAQADALLESAGTP